MSAVSEQAKKFFRYFQDLLIVLRSQFVAILFIGLISFLFLGTSQGLDVSFCIVEDLSAMLPATIVWIIVGIIFWSISLRFSTRLITYMTDNSGTALSPAEISRRTVIQKVVSNAFGIAPSFIAFATFVKVAIVDVYLNHEGHTDPKIIVSLVCIFTLIITTGVYLWWLFYRNGVFILSVKYKWLRWLSIGILERKWANKLYGIFNDIRFQMTSTTANFYRIAINAPLPTGKILPDGRRLPPSFTICEGFPMNEEHTSIIIWMYNAPCKFYFRLLRQFRVLLLLSTAVILFFALFAPRWAFANVGSVALVFVAAACWQVVYTSLHYADKVKYRWKVPVPLRSTLFVAFFLTTFLNHDHSVRRINHDRAVDKRLLLSSHFDRWFTNLKKTSSIRDSDQKIPVVFVTAEGGALRTGGFTTMLLARLADNFPYFNGQIYAFSSVSGGSIGCNIYYAMTKLKESHSMKLDSLNTMAREFYRKDYLAPVIGKFVFGDFINYYIPFHICYFDRAIALEQAWESEFGKLCSNDSSNYLKHEYFGTTANANAPVLLTNTVEVETGRQCVWSNVNISELPRGHERDVFARYLFNIPYSTATNLSSRFPIVSPGAAFYPDTPYLKYGLKPSHYIDGGYYENKGTETMLQVLHVLQEKCPDAMKEIRPYVIQINFGTPDDAKPVRAFSEINEIIAGIYHTRDARGELQKQYLEDFTHQIGGVFISVKIPSKGNVIPNNWVLSERAADIINVITDNIVQLKDTIAAPNWKDLFVYHFKPLALNYR